jgi:hypothetical protein
MRNYFEKQQLKQNIKRIFRVRRLSSQLNENLVIEAFDDPVYKLFIWELIKQFYRIKHPLKTIQ